MEEGILFANEVDVNGDACGASTRCTIAFGCFADDENEEDLVESYGDAPLTYGYTLMAAAEGNMT